MELQAANRKADTLFSLWRAKRRMFELYRADWSEVTQARLNYEQAEALRQVARRDAGLTYLLTPHMKGLIK